MNDSAVAVRKMLWSFPREKHQTLIDAAVDAIDLSDGGEMPRLMFVCEDMIEVLHEEGVEISADELRRLCNAMLSSDSYEPD